MPILLPSSEPLSEDAARVLKTLRANGPQTADELAAALAKRGRAVRPATVDPALGELAELALAVADGPGAPPLVTTRPSRRPATGRGRPSRRPRLPAHLATWLEDAGIPARVIDELMGHEASTRGAQHLGSAMGTHYRHTTPEMATRVTTAIQARLAVVVSTAEQFVEAQPTRGAT